MADLMGRVITTLQICAVYLNMPLLNISKDSPYDLVIKGKPFK